MANWKYFSKAHKTLYKLTNGVIGSRMGGVDMALVHFVGRKSGIVRCTPIACYPYKDSIVVSASNNGLDKHPQWYFNLKAKPEVDVQFKKDKFKALAIELEGEERDQFWQEVIKLNPLQERHQQHTERVIPLIWLKRNN